MKQNTIILSNGQAATVPPGADPTVYRRICEAKLHPAPAKRKPAKRTPVKSRVQAARPGKRSQDAAMKSAVAWGIVETVKRVNAETEIPFDGGGPADDQEGTEAGYGIPSPF